MENVDKDYEILDKGIKQLLGKEAYPPGEVDHGPCVHESDGFIYNLNDHNADVVMLLQCRKCTVQYEVWKSTGQLM